MDNHGFSDLVDHLPQLPKARGDAFERLCRWFLQNAPEYRHRIRKVWLWDDWPGRWGPDKGIDLVAETIDGELWAIQAKAYTPDHSIRKDDVDTFLSESNRAQIAFRLLISTTDLIGNNAYEAIIGQEKPVGLLMRSHLDAVGVEWPASLDVLQAPQRAPATPRPHQVEAIQKVVAGFEDAERGQLIMACGTGKTLVALWVAEALQSQRTLVLAPSLTLLAQTIREWTANASEPFDYIAVCSDVTVAERDAMVSHTSDIGLPVTTDPTEVAAFLGRAGRRVVFSTYQSSPRLVETHALGAPAYDLAIADEAHRCAGPEAGPFATILADDQIRATKRLFMTATPRYFSGRVKKIAGEADFEIASMDEEEKFGNVLHRLTFGEAIDQDLLSDYRVLVIGVDEGMYRDYIDRGELVTLDGQSVTDARMLASHIGVAKAMRDYDLRRVVSFHSRVKRAQEFSSLFPKVLEWMPEDERPDGGVWSKYVSGEMSSGRRDTLLSQLRSLQGSDRGLLSNARCLTEGVDLPTLNGVAFVDPRSSRIGIIQAVGRAIRKSPDKSVGVIVLPVFIPEGDDPEEALRSSAFKDVWNVLNALRAHDEAFAEELDSLRRRLGRGDSADIERPAKVILDVPERVGDGFVRAFNVRLVEGATSSWEHWFGLLERYVAREGHAWPPPSHVEQGVGLGVWVASQRAMYKAKKLSMDRAGRLEALPDWSWFPYDDTWEEGFEMLRHYAQEAGRASPPASHTQDGYKLGQWVGMQRRQYRGGHLNLERIAKLESLPGWSWDPVDDSWEKGFVTLVHYAEREGHVSPPRGFRENGYPLGLWVRNQRSRRRKGVLKNESARRLESLPGWSWEPRDEMWNEGLALLRRFAEREGHARPPAGWNEYGFRLGLWVSHRRGDRVKGRLSPDRVHTLELLPGWSWDPKGDIWESWFRLLNEYADREGQARPPQDHVEDGRSLGTWANNQRTAYSKKKLSEDRIRKLESLPGWMWKPTGDIWESWFRLLCEYTDREGQARPPHDHVENGRSLGQWVSKQRAGYAKGNLSEDRIRKLESLPGWVWKPTGDIWESWFRLLCEYTDREGQARPPRDHVEDGRSLGVWANRAGYAKGNLSEDRIRKLESLPGWVWKSGAKGEA